MDGVFFKDHPGNNDNFQSGPKMEIKDCFYIGYISKIKGLKGELQLFFEFEDYRELEFDVCFVEIDRKLIPFFIEKIKIHDNSTAYLFLEDVDHIDKAQKLAHKKIYLPLDKMPVRDPDDFRITDLKGYRVWDKNQGEIGDIFEIHEFPQQHVAAVLYKEKEILFPLNDAIISGIDRENKTVEVELPDGLLDLYLS